MGKRAPDRRVLRTRKLLQDALTTMMVEKGYEDTTVQDIIDRANVGRATFYAHFADKQTLLASRIEDLRALLTQRQLQALALPGGVRERGLGFSLAILEHASGHRQLYHAIVNKESGAFVLQRIQRMLADLAAIDLKSLGFGRAPVQALLAAQFIAGAFMAVLRWWLDQGARIPPEEVDSIFRRLVLQGLTEG